MQHKDADLSYRDDRGRTFVHMAARLLQVRLLRYLLVLDQTQANMTTYVDKNPGRWTALMCAVETPRDEKTASALHEVVEALLEFMTEESILQVTASGSTVFHQVVARGHLKVLDVILRKMSPDGQKKALSTTNGKAPQ